MVVEYFVSVLVGRNRLNIGVVVVKISDFVAMNFIMLFRVMCFFGEIKH